jgi:hypothetical protein
MKSFFKKLVIALCAMAITMTAAICFVSCGGGQTVKIGVLVADVSGEEALGFKNYYTQYIAKEYDVEFIYSPALEDDATAKAQVETFIGQNCKAIIDMADKDRAGLAKYCNENKIYYAIASGMMSDEDWTTCKSYEYFVGQIGPSMQTEYEAGLAMGQYYKNTKNVSKVAIYGAFTPNPMHLYRLAGVLTGLGDTYNSATGMDIVYAVYADNAQVREANIAGDVTVSYFSGYSDTINDELTTNLSKNPDAVISVGMATTFFTSILNNANMPFSDIDSFTSANGTAMNTGKLEYLAGKYSSSIGPIFAAVMSAINGAPIRDGGNAISISQGYWVAKSYTEFQKFQSADSVSAPIFNKTVLDALIGTTETPVTLAAFTAAVEQDRTPQ